MTIYEYDPNTDPYTIWWLDQQEDDDEESSDD